MLLNNIIKTKFYLMTAMTSVGNVRSYALGPYTQVILNGFGLGQETVQNMVLVGVIPGHAEQFFIGILIKLAQSRSVGDNRTVLRLYDGLRVHRLLY